MSRQDEMTWPYDGVAVVFVVVAEFVVSLTRSRLSGRFLP